MKGIDVLVRLDGGLFPNIKSEPGDMLSRLGDGARVICRFGPDGELVVVTYLHGPQFEYEAERLGLIGAKIVRIRDLPDSRWANGPAPSELLHAAKAVPAALQGRLGTLIRLGSGNKYSCTAAVKLHRVTPGEPRATLELPMIWLEALAVAPSRPAASTFREFTE